MTPSNNGQCNLQSRPKKMPTHPGVSQVNKFRINVFDGEVQKKANKDSVSIEEPLQISLCWKNEHGVEEEREFTVTMRTPGNDEQLAIGLLNSEGIIRSNDDIESVQHISESEESTDNMLEVTLADGLIPDWKQYERHLTTQSSCGICGKTSLQALELKSPGKLDTSEKWLSVETILALSDVMREQQVQFQQTGGVHAVGLFNGLGELKIIKEDVGRHNAMDKVIGTALLNTPSANSESPSAPHEQDSQQVVVLSGRISFELVQKALMAKFPVIVAVGAPSSLAISVAQRFDITLIGFVSKKGFNVYHGGWRLCDVSL